MGGVLREKGGVGGPGRRKAEDRGIVANAINLVRLHSCLQRLPCLVSR